jgi:excinuclease ABC subunit C
MKLTDKVKKLPQLPGVYIFTDAPGGVIYVGKAKNLRSRVGSYFFTNLNKNSKTYSLVQRINDVRYTVVDNEFDALILEASLIKKYLPKYNIVLKDDKSFLYIVIKKDRYPAVTTARKTGLEAKDLNFGPFTSANVAKQVVRILRKIFPFRDCSQSKFNKYRKLGEPCLFGHINLCPAPCTDSQEKNRKNYLSDINKIKKVLAGGSPKLLKGLENKMKKFSRSENYEQASVYRNLLEKFNYIRSNYRDATEYIDNPYLMDDRQRGVETAAYAGAGIKTGTLKNRMLRYRKYFREGRRRSHGRGNGGKTGQG